MAQRQTTGSSPLLDIIKEVYDIKLRMKEVLNTTSDDFEEYATLAYNLLVDEYNRGWKDGYLDGYHYVLPQETVDPSEYEAGYKEHHEFVPSIPTYDVGTDLDNLIVMMQDNLRCRLLLKEALETDSDEFVTYPDLYLQLFASEYSSAYNTAYDEALSKGIDDSLGTPILVDQGNHTIRFYSNGLALPEEAKLYYWFNDETINRREYTGEFTINQTCKISAAYFYNNHIGRVYNENIVVESLLNTLRFALPAGSSSSTIHIRIWAGNYGLWPWPTSARPQCNLKYSYDNTNWVTLTNYSFSNLNNMTQVDIRLSGSTNKVYLKNDLENPYFTFCVWSSSPIDIAGSADSFIYNDSGLSYGVDINYQAIMFQSYWNGGIETPVKMQINSIRYFSGYSSIDRYHWDEDTQSLITGPMKFYYIENNQYLKIPPRHIDYIKINGCTNLMFIFDYDSYANVNSRITTLINSINPQKEILYITNPSIISQLPSFNNVRYVGYDWIESDYQNTPTSFSRDITSATPNRIYVNFDASTFRCYYSYNSYDIYNAHPASHEVGSYLQYYFNIDDDYTVYAWSTGHGDTILYRSGIISDSFEYILQATFSITKDDNNFVTISTTCEKNVTTYYKIDNGSWIEYTEPFHIVADCDVTAKVVDNKGREVISDPVSFEYYIGYIDINEDINYNVTITCSKPVEHIYYKIDNGEWIEYTNTVQILPTCTVTAKVIDSYGVEKITNPYDIMTFSENYFAIKSNKDLILGAGAYDNWSYWNFYYSYDKVTWTEFTYSDFTLIGNYYQKTINLNDDNNIVYFKGTRTGETVFPFFIYSGTDYEAKNNIMSLIYGDNFVGETYLGSTAFYLSGDGRKGFFESTNIKNADKLILPTTTFTRNRVYYRMFAGCSSLETAPELPASVLTEQCYYQMFSGCRLLNYIKCLATDITAANCTKEWVSNVAATGTFVKAASIVGWTSGSSGIPTGWTVQEAA